MKLNPNFDIVCSWYVDTLCAMAAEQDWNDGEHVWVGFPYAQSGRLDVGCMCFDLIHKPVSEKHKQL